MTWKRTLSRMLLITTALVFTAITVPTAQAQAPPGEVEDIPTLSDELARLRALLDDAQITRDNLIDERDATWFIMMTFLQEYGNDQSTWPASALDFYMDLFDTWLNCQADINLLTVMIDDLLSAIAALEAMIENYGPEHPFNPNPPLHGGSGPLGGS